MIWDLQNMVKMKWEVLDIILNQMITWKDKNLKEYYMTDKYKLVLILIQDHLIANWIKYCQMNQMKNQVKWVKEMKNQITVQNFILATKTIKIILVILQK